MFKFIYTRISQDKGSWWITKFDRFRLFCFKGLSGFIVKISCLVRAIKIENECVFFGITHFRRHPFSNIVIGNKCTFRSDHTSNLIGVNHQCILSTHRKGAIITIGNDCGFSGVTIGASNKIQIGNHVLCGANVVITDFDWHLDISNTQPDPVIIHDNVWIGLNTVILKGVEIGENSIIGANSLVVNDIPANVIAGGNPCRVLKAKQ